MNPADWLLVRLARTQVELRAARERATVSEEELRRCRATNHRLSATVRWLTQEVAA
jgi:hypothetical protein